MKYLHPEEIETWVDSLISIKDVYWRGALMVWLLSAWDALNEPLISPRSVGEGDAEIDWDNSHILWNSDEWAIKGDPKYEGFNFNEDFIPAENSRIFLSEIRKQITEDVIVEWADSFSRRATLEQSTFGVPDRLLKKLAAG
jgi:hypothetical protein